MRRTLVIATSLVVLGAAAAATAYAASGPYQGSIAFSPRRSGTPSQPVPTGFRLKLAAAPSTNGSRPPVQLNVKVKIYDLTEDGKDFPTCSLQKIAAAKSDNVCPKGALVASGYIMSTLGPSNNFQTPGNPCDPRLDVWNSGQGKNTYFYVTTPSHQCLGGAVQTGAVAPYPGTYKRQGNYLVSNVPVPPYIDYPITGVAGSLVSEYLVFTAHTHKVHGRTVASIASVGCLKHKRPYSITTTSTDPAAGPQPTTATITGSARCS